MISNVIKTELLRTCEYFGEGRNIEEALRARIDLTRIIIGNPFDRSSKILEFDPEVETICNDIFPALVRIIENDEFAAAAMASHLYEQFTPFSRSNLLSTGGDLLGIRLWEEVLNITFRWEDHNNSKIHKGTPYFFLSENYLLLGDRDLAFTSLLDGFHEDSILGNRTRVGNYPWESPGYFVAIMSDQRNQMGLLIRTLRG